jgi:hypothetical protein
MQTVNEATPPLSLVIAGEYWDSQVYSGRLLLFGRNGNLHRWDWKRLVTENLSIPSHLKFVARAALLGNRLLYERGSQLLLKDPQIRTTVVQKFWDLSESVREQTVESAVGRTISHNYLPFPHNDSEIHYGRLYVGGRGGVHSLQAAEEVDDRKVVKHSDVAALNLAAKYRRVIQAAGSDGLFEIPVPPGKRNTAAGIPIIDIPASRCEWTFSSIAASGPDNRLYVAEFRRSQKTTARSSSGLIFERVIEEDELFGAQKPSPADLTWAAKDRLFRFSDGKIDVVKCSAKSSTAELSFSNFAKLDAAGGMASDNVVVARVAPFGSVVELDDRMVILPTAGEPIILMGEPITWRVFPRSREYINHLHIVYRDHVRIFAFTHDYFVNNQANKKAGFGVHANDEDK